MVGDNAATENLRAVQTLAICGQSALAAATLAVQAHADIELPNQQAKPLANYFLTVAASGERKTAGPGLLASHDPPQLARLVVGELPCASMTLC